MLTRRLGGLGTSQHSKVKVMSK